VATEPTFGCHVIPSITDDPAVAGAGTGAAAAPAATTPAAAALF